MTKTLQTRPGERYARLMSVGGFRGSRVVDNAEMCTMIDSSDEWIRQRTGIAERRWAAEGETPLFMATQAARKAIERAGITADQVDAIIVSTVSHFKQTPSLACELARELGCTNPAALDVSAACAGFCYGIALAEGLVVSGSARHVLIVGVEVLSHLTDLTDRGTAFLFSDGAGAAIVGPSDAPAISPTVWGTDPAQVDVIQIDDWMKAEEAGSRPYIHMDGRSVYLWATTYIADRTREILDKSGLEPEDLDCFVPHQANNRITDSMLRHLKLPESVIVSRDIVNMGNSSAASIPLAIEALMESGRAHSGQTALIIGFGAGLVFGGQVIVLP